MVRLRGEVNGMAKEGFGPVLHTIRRLLINLPLNSANLWFKFYLDSNRASKCGIVKKVCAHDVMIYPELPLIPYRSVASCQTASASRDKNISADEQFCRGWCSL